MPIFWSRFSIHKGDSKPRINSTNESLEHQMKVLPSGATCKNLKPIPEERWLPNTNILQVWNIK
jgi:hypothetical protein